MAKTFMARATLTGIIPKVDGSLSMRFTTEMELSPAEKLTALEYLNSRGWVLFREDEFKSEDVPAQDAGNDETKSPSTRLRNVFFVYWKTHKATTLKGMNVVDFDTFYRREMEKIISTVKDKLE